MLLGSLEKPRIADAELLKKFFGGVKLSDWLTFLRKAPDVVMFRVKEFLDVQSPDSRLTLELITRDAVR